MMRVPFSYLCMFFLLFGLVACSSSSSVDSAEAALKKLSSACKGERFKEASALIAYRGSDPARRYKDKLNGDDEGELKRAKKTCARLTRSMSGDFKITSQKTEKESEGTWHVLRFQSGEKKGAFAFLEIGGAFMLGDID